MYDAEYIENHVIEYSYYIFLMIDMNYRVHMRLNGIGVDRANVQVLCTCSARVLHIPGINFRILRREYREGRTDAGTEYIHTIIITLSNMNVII